MSRIRFLFSRYKGPINTFTSVVLIQLIINLTSGWLENTFGKTPAELLRLIAVLFGGAVFLLVMLRVARITPRRYDPIPQDMKPKPRAGLIVLVGKGRAGEIKSIESFAEYIAIKYHRDAGSLQYVWLLASNDSIPIANQLREIIQPTPAEIIPIQNILSIQETYLAVRAIFDKKAMAAGVPVTDLIADYTGATKPMTAGMVLACGNLIPMQFISGWGDTASAPVQTDFLPPVSSEKEG